MAGTTQHFKDGTMWGIRLADGVTWVVPVAQLNAAGAIVVPNANGQATASNSQPVIEGTSATATTSSVADQATNATILALNTARIGATVYNDSSSILYLKLGATATTTDFTVKLFQDDYYEVPAKYTGRIDGIWSADSTGSARVTELT